MLIDNSDFKLVAILGLLIVLNQIVTTCCQRDDDLECGQTLFSSGYRKIGSHVSHRILNGRDAKPGQVPFQVFIRKLLRQPKNAATRCGGVIISERHILTAAHCLVEFCDSDEPVLPEPDRLQVYIGELNINHYDGEQRIRISEISVKREFCTNRDENHEAVNGDIAMLVTTRPMQFELNESGYGSVNKICLPNKGVRYEEGEKVYTSGWGRVGLHKTANVLQVGESVLLSRGECEVWKNLKADNVCTDANNRGSCKGDSGGPVFRYRSSGQAELVSLVSFGSADCTRYRLPSVSTQVSKYLDWINSFINDSRE